MNPTISQRVTLSFLLESPWQRLLAVHAGDTKISVVSPEIKAERGKEERISLPGSPLAAGPR